MGGVGRGTRDGRRSHDVAATLLATPDHIDPTRCRAVVDRPGVRTLGRRRGRIGEPHDARGRPRVVDCTVRDHHRGHRDRRGRLAVGRETRGSTTRCVADRRRARARRCAGCDRRWRTRCRRVPRGAARAVAAPLDAARRAPRIRGRRPTDDARASGDHVRGGRLCRRAAPRRCTRLVDCRLGRCARRVDAAHHQVGPDAPVGDSRSGICAAIDRLGRWRRHRHARRAQRRARPRRSRAARPARSVQPEPRGEHAGRAGLARRVTGTERRDRPWSDRRRDGIPGVHRAARHQRARRSRRRRGDASSRARAGLLARPDVQ